MSSSVKLVSWTLGLALVLKNRILGGMPPRDVRVMWTESSARSGDNSPLETSFSCWEARISFQIPSGASGLYGLNPKFLVTQDGARNRGWEGS